MLIFRIFLSVKILVSTFLCVCFLAGIFGLVDWEYLVVTVLLFSSVFLLFLIH